MSRDQQWFEMRDLRSRTLDRSPWVPLRSSKTTKSQGARFAEGHEEEFIGISSAAFPNEHRGIVEQVVSWGNLSLMHDHAPYVQDMKYVPSYEAVINDDLQGTYLVLSQRGNAIEHTEWHLHPDLVLGLRLKREGDVWLGMDEGYIPVVRLERGEKGAPQLLEIRSTHLKDFLAARNEFLCLSTYRSRELIVATREIVDWQETQITEQFNSHDRWQGSVTEITEDGHEFGSSMAIFHVGRKDFDLDQDVPEIGVSDNFETHSFTRTFDQGKKLYRIWGELWKVDYIEQGANSPRVRGDDTASLTFFYTDASGNRESAEQLDTKGRWLWFKPDVINHALEFRGSFLKWYTADTGRISMGPDGGVVFGVNPLGLVNVYAKDIRYSSTWQHQVWAGFNIVPDGPVSRELLMSQAEGEPANTQAPEAFLAEGIRLLNDESRKRFGSEFIRSHDDHERLIRLAHRFRAVDKDGFHALAKDLARIIIDSLDVHALQKVVAPPKGEKRGSLKSLESVLATLISPERAHALMTPLFGIYELRHADAHLPSSDLEKAYAMIFVDTSKPWVLQGARMLAVTVGALHRIAFVLSGIVRSSKATKDEFVGGQAQ